MKALFGTVAMVGILAMAAWQATRSLATPEAQEIRAAVAAKLEQARAALPEVVMVAPGAPASLPSSHQGR